MTERLLDFLSNLRFPYLFAITAMVFLLDVVVPDMIPFADELLLGVGTLLLSRIRKNQYKNQD